MAGAGTREEIEREFFDNDSEIVSNRLAFVFRRMQRGVMLELPLDSSAIQFTWSWWIDRRSRYQEMPDRDSVLRELHTGDCRGIPFVTIELLAAQLPTHEPRRYPDRLNIPRRSATEIQVERSRLRIDPDSISIPRYAATGIQVERLRLMTESEYPTPRFSDEDIERILRYFPINELRSMPLTPEFFNSQYFAERVEAVMQTARSHQATPRQLENMSKLRRCVFNAHSPHIKCAVNPAIDCSDCTHFEEEAK